MVEIKLLNNKDYNIIAPAEMRAQNSDYLILQGESNVTEFEITYPDDKATWSKRVDFKTALGRYWSVEFEGFEKPIENALIFQFSLPSEVTIPPYTEMAFKAFKDDSTFVWKRVMLKIWEVSPIFDANAKNNPDLIKDAYGNSVEALEVAQAANEKSDLANAKADQANTKSDLANGKSDQAQSGVVELSDKVDQHVADINAEFVAQNNRIEQYRTNNTDQLNDYKVAVDERMDVAERTANGVRGDFDQIVEQKRDIVQAPGQSASVVMSQKATTDAIAAVFDDITLDGGGA